MQLLFLESFHLLVKGIDVTTQLIEIKAPKPRNLGHTVRPRLKIFNKTMTKTLIHEGPTHK